MTLFLMAKFLGIQKTLSQTLQGQLGVAVGFTNNTSLNGSIWDDADPEFDNFIYSYKLQHTHVAVKAKLLAELGLVAMPWVSGSIGVGFNDAHGFNNTPIILKHCLPLILHHILKQALPIQWELVCKKH